MGKLIIIKINNSRKAAIIKGKWKDPGAKLYDQLLDAMYCKGDIPTNPKDLEAARKSGNYCDWSDFLKEAYAVAPVKDIKNSPYGRTPFSRSGCKYPHHVIKNGQLIVSIPGLRSAYICARNQGVLVNHTPENKQIVAHLNKHFRELGIEPVWHHGELYFQDTKTKKFTERFDFDGVDTVIFDIGSVLSEPKDGKELIKKKYHNKFNETQLDCFVKSYYDKLEDYETASIFNAKKLYQSFLTDDIKQYSDDIFEILALSGDAYDYTDSMIKELKDKGYKLYYLSNWHKSGFELMKQKGKFKYLDQFDGGLVSYDAGCQKPDPKIYQLLIDKFKLNPHTCIFFDDREENIEAAKKIGFKAEQFHRDTVKEINTMKRDNVYNERIAENFHFIQYHIMEKTGINLFDESDYFKVLKSDLDDNFKPKGSLSLSDFTMMKITKELTKKFANQGKLISYMRDDDPKYDDECLLWVDDKGNYVCSITYDKVPNENDGHKWISGMDVAYAYSGYGLSHQLLDYAIAHGVDALSVQMDNEIALKTYKSHGFEISPESQSKVDNGLSSQYDMFLNNTDFENFIDDDVICESEDILIKQLPDSIINNKYFQKWFVQNEDFSCNIDEFNFSVFNGFDKYGLFANGKIEAIIIFGLYHEDFIHIQGFYVNPSVHNKGYGQKLLSYVLNTYKDKEFRIEPYRDNQRAIHIYKKFGFREIPQWYFTGNEEYDNKMNELQMSMARYPVQNSLNESVMSNEALVFNYSTLEEIGHTPEEIYEWMHKNISYDKTITGWKLKLPSEVYVEKKGNCHDQALFEAFIFHSLGIINGQIFFVEFSKDNPIGGNSHTLTWFRTAAKEAKLSADWKAPFKEENRAKGPFKFWWFENAWEDQSGIHGPYNSVNEIKDAVLEVYNNDNDINSHKYDGIVFATNSNYRCGMSLGEYVESWRLDDDRLFDKGQAINEAIEWISRYTHDDIFREYEFIKNKSELDEDNQLTDYFENHTLSDIDQYLIEDVEDPGANKKAFLKRWKFNKNTIEFEGQRYIFNIDTDKDQILYQRKIRGVDIPAKLEKELAMVVPMKNGVVRAGDFTAKYFICVNKYFWRMSADAQDATILHEIGHIVCQINPRPYSNTVKTLLNKIKNMIKKLMVRIKSIRYGIGVHGNPFNELEADAFAIQRLSPEKFQKALEEIYQTVDIIDLDAAKEKLRRRFTDKDFQKKYNSTKSKLESEGKSVPSFEEYKEEIITRQAKHMISYISNKPWYHMDKRQRMKAAADSKFQDKIGKYWEQTKIFTSGNFDQYKVDDDILDSTIESFDESIIGSYKNEELENPPELDTEEEKDILDEEIDSPPELDNDVKEDQSKAEDENNKESEDEEDAGTDTPGNNDQNNEVGNETPNEEEVREEKPEPKKESLPKQADRAESDKNGVRRKKLYIAFIEWSKEYNSRNTFGSIFDKDAFHDSYPFVPHEMRYFYRLANPMLCVLAGDLTFFQVAELRKLNANNKHLDEMLIFAATPKDLRVFNIKDKKVYRAEDSNGEIQLKEVLSDTFDTYIQMMIQKGDILNGPIEDEPKKDE